MTYLLALMAALAGSAACGAGIGYRLCLRRYQRYWDVQEAEAAERDALSMRGRVKLRAVRVRR